MTQHKRRMKRAFNESFATGLRKLCCRRLPMGDKSFMDGPFKHTMDILESRPLEERSLIKGIYLFQPHPPMEYISSKFNPPPEVSEGDSGAAREMSESIIPSSKIFRRK